jgi:16S rRNA (guanine966-N2)-methyltransferase
MSIVHGLLPEAKVLDLCAGSGALGLEALSRGAGTCDFVENNLHAITVIQANLAHLGGHPGATVHREDAARFVATLGPLAYDIAFADPPYAAETGTLLVERWLEVPFAAVFGVEHSSSVSMPAPGKTRRYGSTSLTFFHASTT